MAKRTFIVQEGQTLGDICIMAFGSLERIVEVAEQNGLDSITPNMAAGTELVVDPPSGNENPIVSLGVKRKVKPKTKPPFTIPAYVGDWNADFSNDFNNTQGE